MEELMGLRGILPIHFHQIGFDEWDFIYYTVLDDDNQFRIKNVEFIEYSISFEIRSEDCRTSNWAHSSVDYTTVLTSGKYQEYLIKKYQSILETMAMKEGKEAMDIKDYVAFKISISIRDGKIAEFINNII